MGPISFNVRRIHFYFQTDLNLVWVKVSTSGLCTRRCFHLLQQQKDAGGSYCSHSDRFVYLPSGSELPPGIFNRTFKKKYVLLLWRLRLGVGSKPLPVKGSWGRGTEPGVGLRSHPGWAQHRPRGVWGRRGIGFRVPVLECGQSCVLLRSGCVHLGCGVVSGTLDEHSARTGKLIIKLLWLRMYFGHWSPYQRALLFVLLFSPSKAFPFPHLSAVFPPSAFHILFSLFFFP